MFEPSNPPGNGDRAAEVARVIDDVLRRRRSGESLSDADVEHSHPDLLPELRQRLQNLGLIDAARKRAMAKPASSSPRPFPTESPPATKELLEGLDTDYELLLHLGDGGQGGVH